MASSSSSSMNRFEIPEDKYDVFISFRGEDTRKTFTSHLYAALCQKKIKTFIDDELQKGEEISRSLLSIIQGSRVSLIVFSETFASSKWCLMELVRIMECQKTAGQIVMPVFYRVDPCNIRNQTGNFGIAFDELVKSFKLKELEWRSALRKAGSLSGWDSSNTSSESLLVEKIVGAVLEKLTSRLPPVESIGLVGIDRKVEKVMSLLCIGLEDIRTVGIWGMGGIGKTTIAEKIFNQISNQFESCHFLSNVRETEQKGNLVRARDELISKLLGDVDSHIGTPHFANKFIKDRMQRKRVLLVLDDVDCSRQLETLLGGLDRFGQGSRVILTTRDKQVLYDATETYNVDRLQDTEAFQLFCLHAFGQNHPPELYIELSLQVINYAQGNPLAIKILAASLRGRTKEHWKSEVNKLRNIPNLKVLDVLKVSYDSLDDDEEKEIFLDIACFFKGEKMDDVMRILDGCYYASLSGINVLIDRSLLAISQHGYIEMHDLLQEMGWHVVRREHPKEPGRRSRLWTPEDVHHVLTRNTGTENVTGIFVDLSKAKEMKLNPDVFAKMHNLKFLKFYNGSFGQKGCLLNGLESLPDELRYLSWPGYPSESLPSVFSAEKLVELHLPFSKVIRLWNGTQNLINLKKLDLGYSDNLTELPDFSRLTNLLGLELQNCHSLVEIPFSIQHLNKLTHFNLSGCRNLESLPSNIDLKSLEYLDMHGCNRITKFPNISTNIRDLYLNKTAIAEVPPSVELLSRLVMLNMSDNMRLKYLPDTLQKLAYLRDLKLRGCINLTEFPEIFCEQEGSTKEVSSNSPFLALQELDMYKCKRLKSLPSNIWRLESLRRINVEGTSLRALPSPAGPCKVEYIDVSGCEDRDQWPLLLPSLLGFDYLTSLKLNNLHLMELPVSISCISTLDDLDLSGNDFESLPVSIKELSRLREVNLSYCRRLQSIPELPWCLASLNAHECASLETIYDAQRFFSIDGGGNYIFSNCFMLMEHTKSRIAGNAQVSIEHLRDHDGDESTGLRQMVVCLPGSGIPDWFSDYSTGSSVTIQMPSHWFNEEFRGFAFCLAISFDEYWSGWSDEIRCDCHLISKDGEHFDLHCQCRPWPHYGEKKYELSSNHVFFMYHESLFFDEDEYGFWCYGQPDDWLLEEVSFRFKFGDERVKVESCGVRALYASNPLWISDEDQEDTEEEDAYFEEEEDAYSEEEDEEQDAYSEEEDEEVDEEEEYESEGNETEDGEEDDDKEGNRSEEEEVEIEEEEQEEREAKRLKKSHSP